VVAVFPGDDSRSIRSGCSLSQTKTGEGVSWGLPTNAASVPLAPAASSRFGSPAAPGLDSAGLNDSAGRRAFSAWYELTQVGLTVGYCRPSPSAPAVARGA
jgi:hypothetical protein